MEGIRRGRRGGAREEAARWSARRRPIARQDRRSRARRRGGLPLGAGVAAADRRGWSCSDRGDARRGARGPGGVEPWRDRAEGTARRRALEAAVLHAPPALARPRPSLGDRGPHHRLTFPRVRGSRSPPRRTLFPGSCSAPTERTGRDGMPTDLVFPAQVILALITWSLLARWFLAPRLAGLPRDTALQPLLAVHTLRYIG